MSGEWNAPLTFSGITRLAPFALQSSPALCTASGSPEITVWSGALRFAATTTPLVLEARGADLLDVGRGEAEHRGHGAAPLGARLVHQLAAPPHERARLRRR